MSGDIIWSAKESRLEKMDDASYRVVVVDGGWHYDGGLIDRAQLIELHVKLTAELYPEPCIEVAADIMFLASHHIHTCDCPKDFHPEMNGRKIHHCPSCGAKWNVL